MGRLPRAEMRLPAGALTWNLYTGLSPPTTTIPPEACSSLADTASTVKRTPLVSLNVRVSDPDHLKFRSDEGTAATGSALGVMLRLAAAVSVGVVVVFLSQPDSSALTTTMRPTATLALDMSLLF